MFLGSKEYLHEKSTVQRNKILRIEFSVFTALSSAPFSLIETLMFHVTSSLLSMHLILFWGYFMYVGQGGAKLP